MDKQKQHHEAKLMNLSNVDLIGKSLSRTNISEKDCGQFAWIDSVPDTIHFAINISQIYCKKGSCDSLNDDIKMIKVRIWLEVAGVKLIIPIIKILHLKEHEDLFIWQLEPYDELISLEVPICELKDRDIQLVFSFDALNRNQPRISGLKGSVKVFTESGVLKSGLTPLTIGGEESHEISKLERAIHNRKSKEVPIWHVQLMKERLKEMKREFCDENPQAMVMNIVIPTPSYPLKLKTENNNNLPRLDDLCERDVNESQEDSMIKRRFPKLFSDLNTTTISNGDLRALRGILHRGFGTSNDNTSNSVPVDAANLLWTHREFLSRKYPNGLVSFVQSVQWWLSASDPTEIDEALRIISNWNLPKDSGHRMEIAVELMVAMCSISGMSDSEVWQELFQKLIVDPKLFMTRYQSALLLFLTSDKVDMDDLKKYLKEFVLFSGKEDVNMVSELYWRLKSTKAYEHLFKEYKETLTESLKSEIRKQERLFESIEGVLMAAQRLKGTRLQKLEAIKKGLGDPESGVPSAAQQIPLLPGLQDISETGGGDQRITAVIPERSNLFKSTAFTVLIVFLRESTRSPSRPLSLPIIFKRGDDLRKDAACLRVFRTIWTIWREEGGLELFPRKLLYGVVPLGEESGLVEFVESVPLSRVMNSGEDETTAEWSIKNYLKSLPDPLAPKNFLPSCVGFSLLTYVLGIGDRHLDNLLLTPSGHLLHIDFSFVFGADPKPFAPPIKVTREMVRGFEQDRDEEMTGEYLIGDIDKWNEFKGLCFTALTLLRRKSPLILSLLRSEYPTSTSSTSTSSSFSFVQERLSVLVSQSEALAKFDKLMEESRRAMFPQVMETIHKWVQYWKS